MFIIYIHIPIYFHMFFSIETPMVPTVSAGSETCVAYVLRSELDTLQERRRHFRGAADPLATEALCLIVPGHRTAESP